MTVSPKQQAGRHRPTWTVTHLPSGLRVTPGATGFSNLEMAKAFADRLAALGDWSSIDDKVPNRLLGRQVASVWNELIALDMAKTVDDHYGNMPERSSSDATT